MCASREWARSARQKLAEGAGQDLAPRRGQLIDGPLRPPALLLALEGMDPALVLEDVDGVVEGAEVQADEHVEVAIAHGRCHLVGVHRPLIEQLQDRQGEGGDLGFGLGHILHIEYMKFRYPPSSTPGGMS